MLPFGGQCIRKHGRAEIGSGPYCAPPNTSLLRECGGAAGVFGVESTKAGRTPETDIAQGGGIYKRCARLFSTQRQTGSYQATKKDCPPLSAFLRFLSLFQINSNAKNNHHVNKRYHLHGNHRGHARIIRLAFHQPCNSCQ